MPISQHSPRPSGRLALDRSPPPAPARGPEPGSEAEADIDRDRLVWDPEYREAVRRRLRREHGPA